MNSAGLGFFILVIAGLMNASFAVPMKYTKRWAWENTWMVWTFFALVLLPAVAAFVTLPGLVAVYSASSVTLLWHVAIFGAGWGLAQVFFGIAVDAIGIALTFSLVLGTSAAVGALIPLLMLHSDELHTTTGHMLLLGIALLLVGVAICAVAGSLRDKPGGTEAAPRKNSASGLILAILCGALASFQNFGLAFGAPLLAIATAHGANKANSANAVWLPLLLAGAIPNLLYCIYLVRKNSTAGKFSAGGVGYWFLAFLMGGFWFGSLLLYGAAVPKLGALGPAVGWPLYMSLIVVAASLLGIVTGEWKHSGRKPLTIQLAGVAILIVAIVILSRAS
jgi:L-rhamnose-H+ transport protein